MEYIDRMQDKPELADQLGAHSFGRSGSRWEADDNQTRAALLGFGQQQAYDNATKVVAAIDQGGLGLPNRDFYLKDDDKSKEILSEYEASLSARCWYLEFQRKPQNKALPK